MSLRSYNNCRSTLSLQILYAYMDLLFIADKPSTNAEPNDRDADPIEGEPYSLKCLYNARPDIITSYTWTKGGSYLSYDGQILTLELEHPRDTADFTCSAENSLGEGEQSDAYPLKVYCECGLFL